MSIPAWRPLIDDQATLAPDPLTGGAPAARPCSIITPPDADSFARRSQHPLHDHDAARRVALEWLRIDTPCRMILNPDFTVCWGHPRIAEILGAQGEVQIRDNALWFATGELKQRFVNFVAELDDAPQVFTVRDEVRGTILLLRCRMIDGGGEQYLCFEARTAAGFEPIYGALPDVFNLTAAELRVLNLALRGMDATAIAHKCNVSLATVRSQFQQIYSKVGSSTREELFNRVAPFRFY